MAKFPTKTQSAEVGSERYPRLVEAAVPLSEGVDPGAYFAFGLDLLLAGIEAMAARKRRGLGPELGA